MHKPDLVIFLILFISVSYAEAAPSIQLNDESCRPAYIKDIQTMQSKIVGGQSASRYQFPYQISLLYHSSSHICGGSIISPNYILTAAHCVVPSSPANYEIVAGILSRGENTPETQRRNVAVITNHPRWPGGHGVAPNDIGLLRLASPLIYTRAVQPIRLPEHGSVFSGKTILSGWGSTSTSSTSLPTVLQWTEQQLITYKACRVALIALRKTAEPLRDSMICTTRAAGTGHCSADSGGPLAQNGVLVGIVSWGLEPCGRANAPDVYTRTSSFRKWIDSTIDNLPKTLSFELQLH